jgi:hypothetical protein
MEGTVKVQDVERIRAEIFRCLTEDFEYGQTKKGRPLKRPRLNQAIFNADEGWPVFSGTDLEMVMFKVNLGLALAYPSE